MAVFADYEFKNISTMDLILLVETYSWTFDLIGEVWVDEITLLLSMKIALRDDRCTMSRTVINLNVEITFT